MVILRSNPLIPKTSLKLTFKDCEILNYHDGRKVTTVDQVSRSVEDQFRWIRVKMGLRNSDSMDLTTPKVRVYIEPMTSEMEPAQINSAPRRPRILLAASGNKASLPNDVILYTDEEEWSTWKKIGDSVLHIELRRWADIMVIAPLSANTLGKIAGGLCDNLLTCIVRAWDYNKPLFMAPAMNTLMWNNPFTERHLMIIDELGISLIPPVSKRLTCGDYGNGAMAEPSLIFSTVRLFYESRSQSGGSNMA
ncbi:hypothetical protein K7X08_013251 [Anisodus acutangulus]|uniref:phosphopantothenoylcysteine decarboxylase n=1 Tax=Anisodus acutangulus TaxID=402998 RepID=A0A9Q1RGQ7_9SOLA|nr:hypothetical protein K7X08_013251 [Anisodus acutangulus]